MGKWPDFDTKLCTYILDIVSGNGRVAMIDRPFGYNNDIQPFLPCSVLQGGVVERKHDRKTQTAAVTWAFRSMAARRRKQLREPKRTDLNLRWRPSAVSSHHERGSAREKQALGVAVAQPGLHASGFPFLSTQVLTSLTKLDVIGFPCLSLAPSATMIMFSLVPLERV